MCVPNTLGHTCAGLLAAKGASPGESNMSRCCRGRTKNEKFLLSAIAVKFFFFFLSAVDKPGLQQGRGEGKARRGRGSPGYIRTSVMHWKQLGVLSVRLEFPVFSTEVTQAAQHSAHSARQIVPEIYI